MCNVKKLRGKLVICCAVSLFCFAVPAWGMNNDLNKPTKEELQKWVEEEAGKGDILVKAMINGDKDLEKRLDCVLLYLDNNIPKSGDLDEVKDINLPSDFVYREIICDITLDLYPSTYNPADSIDGLVKWFITKKVDERFKLPVIFKRLSNLLARRTKGKYRWVNLLMGIYKQDKDLAKKLYEQLEDGKKGYTKEMFYKDIKHFHPENKIDQKVLDADLLRFKDLCGNDWVAGIAKANNEHDAMGGYLACYSDDTPWDTTLCGRVGRRVFFTWPNAILAGVGCLLGYALPPKAAKALVSMPIFTSLCGIMWYLQQNFKDNSSQMMSAFFKPCFIVPFAATTVYLMRRDTAKSSFNKLKKQEQFQRVQCNKVKKPA